MTNKTKITENLNVKWQDLDNDGIFYSPLNLPPNEDMYSELPSGIYSTTYDEFNNLWMFSKQEKVSDGLVKNDDPVCVEIMNDVEKFLNSKDVYNRFNFIWKRGILLYGPPGSGKSTILSTILELFTKKYNGISFNCESFGALPQIIKAFRQQEPNRTIMVTIEDVDMLERQGYEEVLLDLLDGQRQFDNIIYVATTNYIDRLSDRITNRPSRFDIVKLIDVPDVKARYDFLVNIMVSTGEVVPDKELEELAQYTEGYSYAHIKELVILIYVMGLDRSESLDRVGSLVKQGTEIPEDVTNHKVSEFHPDYYGYGDKAEVAEYDTHTSTKPYVNNKLKSS